MKRTTQAILRGLAVLLACGLVGACAGTPATSAPSDADSIAIAPALATASSSSFESLAPSAGVESPTPGVIPLFFGCSHDAPCNLEAGTYETSGQWAFLRGLR